MIRALLHVLRHVVGCASYESGLFTVQTSADRWEVFFWRRCRGCGHLKARLYDSTEAMMRETIAGIV